MEFLNTEPEANNEFWLWLDDEDERLYPEDIASPDIQKALNAFCFETFQFLRRQFPNLEDKLLLALKQNQSISDLLTLPYDYSECMNEIASLILRDYLISGMQLECMILLPLTFELSNPFCQIVYTHNDFHGFS